MPSHELIAPWLGRVLSALWSTPKYARRRRVRKACAPSTRQKGMVFFDGYEEDLELTDRLRAFAPAMVSQVLLRMRRCRQR